MITQAHAKAAILEEWYAWPKGGSANFPFDGISFYQTLGKTKPHLFRFKCSGDPWQVVKGWLLNSQAL